MKYILRRVERDGHLGTSLTRRTVGDAFVDVRHALPRSVDIPSKVHQSASKYGAGTGKAFEWVVVRIRHNCLRSDLCSEPLGFAGHSAHSCEFIDRSNAKESHS